ncbi:MAG: prolyl-tRNA synthetase associated domain-containing protein [Candidatus Magasanikbacteria bacterium CG_4_10_14_0_2_um_filter_37_12]|uniref:Prolyl-tRNA synthetase associated domain-containing protein n=1 Tax=Candidatus Magasanikbacteria bacterium CG_4_10_14_0_2_um_filter_37_12 TaxID=1974637 RepID=A0A2M7V878_9BACT|nr:MAG: prolyl-tRNA synthetase associated domain-containing protein [Candidatus Magasanikbacteria bacterium CG_4_10_14_0_2_um_filter_37_12]
MMNIYQVLDDLKIKYTKYIHQPVYTIAEAERYCSHIPGGKSKNLLLRNRKGNKHYLVVVRSDKKLDLEKLQDFLQESNLSFASEERLMKCLGLTPGSVSPFGLVNDLEKEVQVVIDSDLLEYDELQYHPNINTETLVLSVEDFKKFLDWTGNEVNFLEL